MRQANKQNIPASTLLVYRHKKWTPSLSNVPGTCRKPMQRKQENAHYTSERAHYYFACSFYLQVSEHFE